MGPNFAFCLLAGSSRSRIWYSPEAVKKRLDNSEKPDIELTADVKARELRFEEVPETEVRPPAQTERENLPEEVEPGVTYRNPRIRLRIASALTDADRGYADGAP
jgi:hypothetical protein